MIPCCCFYRRPDILAEKSLSCRTQFHRPSKAMLKVGSATLEQEVESEFRPPGEFLAASSYHQRGQSADSRHDLADLRQGGIQSPTDVDAILDQVEERLRPSVMSIGPGAPGPRRRRKGQLNRHMIRRVIHEARQEGRDPGEELQGSRPPPEPGTWPDLSQGAEAITTPTKRSNPHLFWDGLIRPKLRPTGQLG